MFVPPYKVLLFMLWVKIKLTSYDFSDLQITGEFDNRPGKRRFLRIFSCVVTYRTGAGRRLNMITSTDYSCLRPGAVESYDVWWKRRPTAPVDDLWPLLWESSEMEESVQSFYWVYLNRQTIDQFTQVIFRI